MKGSKHFTAEHAEIAEKSFVFTLLRREFAGKRIASAARERTVVNLRSSYGQHFLGDLGVLGGKRF
jgi:hypothetical protein